MPLSDATPAHNGAAFEGTSTDASRGDHVHPVQWPALVFINTATEQYRLADDTTLVIAAGESAVFPVMFTNSNTVEILTFIDADPGASGVLRGSLFEGHVTKYWGDTLIQERSIADVNGLTGWQSFGNYPVSAGKLYWFAVINDTAVSITFEAGAQLPIPTPTAATDVRYAVNETSPPATGVDLDPDTVSSAGHDAVPCIATTVVV